MAARTHHTRRRWKVLVFGVSLALATALGSRTTLTAADDPKADELPKGARLRLGTAAVARSAASYTLLPPDFTTSIAADYEGRVHRFDAITGRPLDKAAGRNAIPGSAPVVLSADGKRFATLRGTSLFVRNVDKGQVVQELKQPEAGGVMYSPYGLQSLSLSADGKVLAQSWQSRGTSGKDQKGEVRVWDVDENKVVARVEPFHQGPSLPTLSPDGTVLATRSAQPYYGGGERPNPDPNRTIQVWNVESGKELFKAPVTGSISQAAQVAFSPNGRTMAISGGDGPIDLWDVPTGKLKATLLGRTRQGQRLAFSPDGKALAAVAYDGTIQRWSVADGKALGTTETPGELPVTVAQGSGGLAFAGNERVVAWGNLGQFPVVWEAPSGKILTPVPQHYQAVRSVAFAAGGKEVVTAGTDGRLVRWDATTGKPLGDVAVRAGRMTGSFRYTMSLAPDGTRALTTNNPAVLFDLATGAELLTVPSATSPGPYQMSVVPSADLSKVVSLSVSYDAKKTGAGVVWDLVAQKKLGEVELPGGNAGYPPAAAVSPSGERLVTVMNVNSPNPNGGVGRMLVITGWDLKTGKRLGVVEEAVVNYGQVQVAAASEMSVIVSTGGGRVRLYDYESGKGGDEIEAAAPRGGADPSSPIVLSPDRKRFAIGVTTEGGYGVRVYDWPSARPLHTFTGLRTPTSALAFSPDGKTLASGSVDTSVLLWDMSAVKEE